MWVQLSTTCSNVLKQPNGKLLVAVNHNQLRIMASETVDPIDWSHPPPSWAVPPERLVHSINQCSLSEGTERATAACEATTLPMRPLRVYMYQHLQASSLCFDIYDIPTMFVGYGTFPCFFGNEKDAGTYSLKIYVGISADSQTQH